jgi:hypothetical protein
MAAPWQIAQMEDLHSLLEENWTNVDTRPVTLFPKYT